MQPIQHSQSTSNNTNAQNPNSPNPPINFQANIHIAVNQSNRPKIKNTEFKQHQEENGFSQLFPELKRIFGRSERNDEALESGNGRVDLEDTRRDCLRRVLLSVDEISPKRHRTAGF